MASIYLIGSLRNPEVPKVAQALRAEGHEVFDDWHAAGPTADEEWQRYEMGRGRTYPEALQGYAAWHTFHYDLSHLDLVEVGILMHPAGRSSHLELGYLVGKGKRGYVLFERYPESWDVMYRFAHEVFDDLLPLLEILR